MRAGDHGAAKEIYGFQEAIEMFAVLFSFTKIILIWSLTHSVKNVMLDSCFVLSGTHQQHQILVLTFALVCSFPPTNSERTWTDSKIIKHHNFRRFENFEILCLWLLIGGAVMCICSTMVLAPVPASDSDLAGPSPDAACYRDRYPP